MNWRGVAASDEHLVLGALLYIGLNGDVIYRYFGKKETVVPIHVVFPVEANPPPSATHNSKTTIFR